MRNFHEATLSSSHSPLTSWPSSGGRAPAADAAGSLAESQGARPELHISLRFFADSALPSALAVKWRWRFNSQVNLEGKYSRAIDK